MDAFLQAVKSVFEWIKTSYHYVEDLAPIVSAVLGFLAGNPLYKRYVKNYKVRHILSLGKRNSQIIVPIRTGVLNMTANGKEYEVAEYSYMELNETQAVIKIPEHLGGIHTKKQKVELAKNSGSIDPCCNVFSFGGFLANDYICRVFRGESGFCFKCNLYIGAKEYYGHCEFDNIRDDLMCYDEVYGFKGLYYGTSKENVKRVVFRNCGYEDYVIMVKIASEDFDTDGSSPNTHGTVHLFASVGAEGAINAAEKIFTDTRVIYRQLRKKKELKHYFFVIPCSKEGKVDFQHRYDLTKVFFDGNFDGDEGSCEIYDMSKEPSGHAV